MVTHCCRAEVEKLRSGNQAKNDHLTVQWLTGSVAELRAEVAELSASVNRTEELAAREALGREVRLVRGDVKTLRRELGVLRAQQEAKGAALVEEIRELTVRCDHKVSYKPSRFLEYLSFQRTLSVGLGDTFKTILSFDKIVNNS